MARADIFFTMTMAGILEKQGFLEDALVIYNILAEEDPGDMSVKEKIEELKTLASRSRRKKGSREGQVQEKPC